MVGHWHYLAPVYNIQFPREFIIEWDPEVYERMTQVAEEMRRRLDEQVALLSPPAAYFEAVAPSPPFAVWRPYAVWTNVG